MLEPLAPESLDVDRLARAIFLETNRVRREMKRPPFESLPRLNAAADLQATANALSASASHFNVVSTWATPFDRVRSLGLEPAALSENAAVLPLLDVDPGHDLLERSTPEGTVRIDQQTGEPVHPHTYASFAHAIVDAWMHSPEHRANIVNPVYRFLGCSARAGRSVTGFEMITSTQVFFTPRDR